MSKNIIFDLVSDLNTLIEGVDGFCSLVPYGTDHDDFNAAVRLFLIKISSDLEICRNNALFCVDKAVIVFAHSE